MDYKLKPLKHIVEKLGGISALSKRLNLPQSTVSNWVHRDNAKRKHCAMILKVARNEGVDIKADDFFDDEQKEPTEQPHA